MDASGTEDGLQWLAADARQGLSVTGASHQLPNLAIQSTLVDPRAGTVWRRRGTDTVPEKRLQRLLADPTVRVLHAYLGRVQEVPPAKRALFWSRAQTSMAESPYSQFHAAEFKNDQHAHLLVVQEDC